MTDKIFRDKLNVLIETALKEDGIDATTNAIFSKDDITTGNIICKENGILACLYFSLEVFRKLDNKIEVQPHFKDGDEIKAGDILATVKGKVHTILRGERICLNILQRACGIATKTGRIVDMISETGTTILDTRKTLPGLRFLDKYSVKCGGGQNHRMGLDDMVMIKDNHIDRAGGIKQAVNKVRNSDYNSLNIEVECRTLEDVKKCVELNVDRIMLDNMSIGEIKKCVDFVKNKIPLEVSGGVTENTVKDIAKTGVDYVSIGALTHSVNALDISLKINKEVTK